MGFWVVRTDGTSLDFSFIKAIAWASLQSGMDKHDLCGRHS
ncbi:DUF3223 domain-containing protein [Rhizobium etli]